MLGVYNSDYQVALNFTYQLSIYVPSEVTSWLHPYMSVVLGITSSIILCLFLTLCRKVVQHHGLGPWRSRRTSAVRTAAAAAVQVRRGKLITHMLTLERLRRGKSLTHILLCSHVHNG